ncbi:unnamed protein product [Linum trigynum]|uniref:Tf2-1-like SH3-like domain-containing protein n=1 Tax=Linum trigynum TaxID=586398 RepID=A0AAV2CHC2_9ROSI
MKQLADAGRREEEFAVGDLVLLRLHLYRQSVVFRRAYQKLAAKYFGSYEVLERVGPVAYRLHLPETSSIHPTFHVVLLQRYPKVHVLGRCQFHRLRQRETCCSSPWRSWILVGCNAVKSAILPRNGKGAKS